MTISNARNKAVLVVLACCTWVLVAANSSFASITFYCDETGCYFFDGSNWNQIAGPLSGTQSSAAQSKCDSTITKAAAKNVACKGGVYTKAQKSGGPADSEKLTKCEAKFDTACQTGKAVGDCVVQQAPCAAIEGFADTCAASLAGGFAP